MVMQKIEEQTLATYSETLPLWLRYVDDTIIAYLTIAYLMRSLLYTKTKSTNSTNTWTKNTGIQFTKEIEDIGETPFLNCLVIRNTLRTTVYRKPAHTDRLLDQTSYSPTF